VGAVRMLALRLASAQRALVVHRWKAGVDRLAGRLRDLNPDRVLARGYSRTVLERTGRVLSRATDARDGDVLRTHLAEGEVASRVTGTETGGDAQRGARGGQVGGGSRGERVGGGSRGERVGGGSRGGSPHPPRKARGKGEPGPTLFDDNV
ncbi:MAG: hypothetical protein IMZ55_04335, partial [Acidobacteria bacterium]|nr:hypothetical protein [Acidobacteriota bacterium]